MRFLGVGEDCSLGDMYLRLAAAGHEVKIHVSDPKSADVLRGMGLVSRVADWEAELDWIRRGGVGGIICSRLPQKVKPRTHFGATGFR